MPKFPSQIDRDSSTNGVNLHEQQTGPSSRRFRSESFSSTSSSSWDVSALSSLSSESSSPTPVIPMAELNALGVEPPDNEDPVQLGADLLAAQQRHGRLSPTPLSQKQRLLILSLLVFCFSALHHLFLEPLPFNGTTWFSDSLDTVQSWVEAVTDTHLRHPPPPHNLRELLDHLSSETLQPMEEAHRFVDAFCISTATDRSFAMRWTKTIQPLVEGLAPLVDEWEEVLYSDQELFFYSDIFVAGLHERYSLCEYSILPQIPDGKHAWEEKRRSWYEGLFGVFGSMLGMDMSNVTDRMAGRVSQLKEDLDILLHSLAYLEGLQAEALGRLPPVLPLLDHAEAGGSAAKATRTFIGTITAETVTNKFTYTRSTTKPKATTSQSTKAATKTAKTHVGSKHPFNSSEACIVRFPNGGDMKLPALVCRIFGLFATPELSKPAGDGLIPSEHPLLPKSPSSSSTDQTVPSQSPVNSPENPLDPSEDRIPLQKGTIAALNSEHRKRLGVSLTKGTFLKRTVRNETFMAALHEIRSWAHTIDAHLQALLDNGGRHSHASRVESLRAGLSYLNSTLTSNGNSGVGTRVKVSWRGWLADAVGRRDQRGVERDEVWANSTYCPRRHVTCLPHPEEARGRLAGLSEWLEERERKWRNHVKGVRNTFSEGKRIEGGGVEEPALEEAD